MPTDYIRSRVIVLVVSGLKKRFKKCHMGAVLLKNTRHYKCCVKESKLTEDAKTLCGQSDNWQRLEQPLAAILLCRRMMKVRCDARHTMFRLDGRENTWGLRPDVFQFGPCLTALLIRLFQHVPIHGSEKAFRNGVEFLRGRPS